ncbi:MAG: SRPBCC family protein [Actinomycetota bacterium]
MILEHWGATDTERSDALPGDELVTDPAFSATRSISLAAPPDDVFGWLAQMGTGRGGWYSYDLVDNFGRRSATELRPEWQVSAVGDRVPAGPLGFTVTDLDRPHHLVLALLDAGGLGHGVDFSLAYRIDEAEDGAGTRLVSRARASVSGLAGAPLGWLLGVGDGFMVRRQLLGLKRRCG